MGSESVNPQHVQHDSYRPQAKTRVHSPRSRVTRILADAVMNKIVVLYRYGQIKYRDVFGVTRTTRYCMFFDSQNRRAVACPEPGSNTFE